jgi:hypothetical protein
MVKVSGVLILCLPRLELAGWLYQYGQQQMVDMLHDDLRRLQRALFARVPRLYTVVQ